MRCSPVGAARSSRSTAASHAEQPASSVFQPSNPSCVSPLATGAGCNYSIKCVAGDVCNVTCQPIVGLGSPCTPPAMEDTCAAGSRCSGTTCTALPKVGENCAQTQACAGGYCDNLSGTPTCTAYRNIGDACDQDQQCASQLCSAQKCVAPGEFYCHSV